MRLREQRYNVKAIVQRFLLCFIVIVLVYILDYHCLFQTYLRIPCLGCGMSRAWKSVAFGQWDMAFEYHRAFYLVPIAGLYLLKGGLLFRNKLWDIILIMIIVLGFLENYLHRFFAYL